MALNVGVTEGKGFVLNNTEVRAVRLGTNTVYINNFVASGGTTGSFVSGSKTYKFHKFTGNGTFSVTSGFNPNINVLVVGGGAGGGTSDYPTYAAGNGGGGGGVLYRNNFNLNSGSYSITVGNGGLGAKTGPTAPQNGSPSSLIGNTISLIASGGYTGEADPLNNIQGNSGEPTQFSGGTWYYDGSGFNAGGGGGGASEAGANGAKVGADEIGGNGGDGLQFNMDGTASYFGGGGGGGIKQFGTNYGLGGLGGGGNGGSNGTSPTNAVANTGGGGGGEGNFGISNTGNGGSGIVYITYVSQSKVVFPDYTTSGLVIWSDTTSLTGSVLYDKSGRGNNALVSGSTLQLTGSNGFMFNGTDNYLTWPTTLSGQPSSSYTLEYFGTPFSSSVNYDFFAKDFYTNGWDMIYEPGPAKLTYRDVAGSDKTSSLFTPSTTQTQQIVVTVNSDTNVIQFYRNGEFVGNFSRTTDVVNPFNAFAGPFKFGFNTNADATYFKGSLKSVSLYNKVLSATEVESNYAYLTL